MHFFIIASLAAATPIPLLRPIQTAHPRSSTLRPSQRLISPAQKVIKPIAAARKPLQILNGPSQRAEEGKGRFAEALRKEILTSSEIKLPKVDPQRLRNVKLQDPEYVAQFEADFSRLSDEYKQAALKWQQASPEDREKLWPDVVKVRRDLTTIYDATWKETDVWNAYDSFTFRDEGNIEKIKAGILDGLENSLKDTAPHPFE